MEEDVIEGKVAAEVEAEGKDTGGIHLKMKTKTKNCLTKW